MDTPRIPSEKNTFVWFAVSTALPILTTIIYFVLLLFNSSRPSVVYLVPVLITTIILNTVVYRSSKSMFAAYSENDAPSSFTYTAYRALMCYGPVATIILLRETVTDLSGWGIIGYNVGFALLAIILTISFLLFGYLGRKPGNKAARWFVLLATVVPLITVLTMALLLITNIL